MQHHLLVKARRDARAVGDHQQTGRAVPQQVQQQLQHFVTGAFVEVTGGFVRQQQAGARRQGSSYRYPLLLAAGQLFGVTPEQVTQAESLHKLPLPRRIEAPGQARLEGQVVFDPQAADQVELLEHQADLGAPPVGQLRFAHLVQVLIADLDAATVDLVEPGHQVEQAPL
eukprot:gene5097-7832_t